MSEETESDATNAHDIEEFEQREKRKPDVNGHDIVISPHATLTLQPVMDLEQAKKHLREFQQFVREYLKEGEDYGTIPGVAKPSLLKAGADKLCELYGFADAYEFVFREVSWTTGLFDYEVRCVLTSKRDGTLVSTGLGCCSSFESKYRWRDQKRKCPQCQKENITKGKKEYGGGWLCWKKTGGCGTTFKDDDKSITDQPQGKIDNPDICDLKNTILKMAKKRAKIDATLAATRSSGIFTQDMEQNEAESSPPLTYGCCSTCGDDLYDAVQGKKALCEKCESKKLESKLRQGVAIAEDVKAAKSVEVITEPQRIAIFARGHQAGKSEEEIRAIYQFFGFEHSALVTRDKYQQVLNAIEDVNYKAPPKPTNAPGRIAAVKAGDGGFEVSGTPERVQKGKKGDALWVEVVGLKLASYNKAHWELLSGSVGKHCRFVLSDEIDKVKFTGKIKSILQIADKEWEPDGTPILRYDKQPSGTELFGTP